METKKSIAELAADACAMPWEDKAPFSCRYEFQQAVTPELFTELLKALDGLLNALPSATTHPAIKAARAAIAKAEGKQ